MKMYAHLNTALLLLAVAGCATTPKPITEDDVRNNIKVTIGDSTCPSCSKIKTYSSLPVVRAETHYSNSKANGWINAKVNLVVTNQTENHIPRYELIAEFTNSGTFADSTDLYIRGGDRLTRVGDRQKSQCWSNVGSGCSWVQAYAIGASRIESTANSGDLDLFIGKPVDYFETSNDGYSKRSVMKSETLGMSVTIPHAAITGFIKGLQDRGADIPTSGKELQEHVAKKFADADRMVATQERLDRDRPQKKMLGTKLCRQGSVFLEIGYVEDSANERVKIRISDAILPSNPQVHPGGFHEQIVWDNPDNWELCGGNN